MKICSRAVGFLTLVLVAFSWPVLHAQQRHAPARDLLSVLPSALSIHAGAIGPRVTVPGKERTMFSGLLRGIGTQNQPLTIVTQLPNLVFLDGLRPNAPPVVFNGMNPVYAGSPLEEQLLEIFSSDIAESMMASIKDGAAVHLLGRRVRVDEAGSPQSGAQRDIFEVAVSVRSSASNRERLKRYYFDSETGLLAKTQYLDEAFSPPMNVEVLFSDWRSQDGSAYPRQIDRKENGHPVFSLTLSSIVALPRQDPTSFAQSAQAGLEEE